MKPQAAAFSPSGVFLAIGFSNGTVKICGFKIPENVTSAATHGGDLSQWMAELISTRESRDAVTHVSDLLAHNFNAEGELCDEDHTAIARGVYILLFWCATVHILQEFRPPCRRSCGPSRLPLPVNQDSTLDSVS